MPTSFKKIILSILSAFVVLFSFAPYFAASAQATQPAPTDSPTWYKQDFGTWYSKVNDSKNPSEIFGERYTSAQVEWVIYGFFAFVINHTSGDAAGACIGTAGSDVSGCLKAIENVFTDLNKTKTTGSVQNKSWAELLFPTDRQLSAVAYVRNKVNDFSLIPTAHAQTPGFGFSAFNPVVDVWRSVRDFSFLLAIVATIILAFMVMFRVKISPQAVITAQSAIPKVIVGLIFVAFSYAIAGLLVDLTYLLIGLVSLFFGANGNPKIIFDTMTNGMFNLGVLGLMGAYLLTLGSMAIFMVVGPVMSFGVAWNTVGGGVMNVISSIGNTAFGVVLAFLLLLLVVVAFFVLLFMFFKIMWLMIKTLAQIYLLVIFGPLQIIAGAAMPSSNALGFGAWAKALFSNLIVYPIVGALFMLSFLFVDLSAGIMFKGTPVEQYVSTLFTSMGFRFMGQGNASGWNPPLTVGGDNYFGLAFIFLAISFVVITIIPKTTELIQSIMSGKPFGFGAAIGEATSPVQTGSKAATSFAVGQYERAGNMAGKSIIGSVLRTIGYIR